VSRYFFFLKQLSKRLSIRASAFGALAIILALFASYLAPFVPKEWADILGNNAVDEILKIVASSMLIIVTFSLATMVASFTAASEGVTPRAARLLMEDKQSQNVLSIFLGAFIFSIISIITLSTGYYGNQGRFIIFIFSVLMIVVIVWTIIVWFEKLSSLGRVHETIERVEFTTCHTIENTIGHLIAPKQDPQQGEVHFDIYLDAASYVQSISLTSLQKIAKDHDIHIELKVMVGSFVFVHKPIARVSHASTLKNTNELTSSIQNCFGLGSCRTFEEDPRFGFITLGEIASRALSPAVNDPGTAIDVIASMTRLFTKLDRFILDSTNKKSFDRLYLKSFDPNVFFEDIAQPISRDGASHIEVVIRLYKSLKAIERLSSQTFGQTAILYQKKVLDRALQSLIFEDDRALLQKTIDEIEV